MVFAQLLAVTLAIVLGVRLFTNGIEWAGFLTGLPEAAVGSLLAAWGTALPETIVPVLAIMSGVESREAVGTGAILGAPLLLSTLALAMLGVQVGWQARGRRRRPYLEASSSGLRRDLGFFLLAFTVGLAVSKLAPGWRTLAALLLLAGYSYFVRSTLGGSRDGHPMEPGAGLIFAARSRRPATWAVLLQTAIGFGAILIGAELFVGLADTIATHLGVGSFLLAALVTPLATELPEVINSLVWVARGKDVLAVANLTGAMVFQGSVVPALGMLLTAWRLGWPELAVGIVALAAAALILSATRRGRIPAGALVFVGFLYPILWVWLLTHVG